jgi:hypothetical protein
MNTRIKDLAIQAGLYVDFKGEPWPKWLGAEECEQAYAKFAELMVSESIAVVQRRFMGDLNREDMEVRRCVADLQKHFGVET